MPVSLFCKRSVSSLASFAYFSSSFFLKDASGYISPSSSFVTGDSLGYSPVKFLSKYGKLGYLS